MENNNWSISLAIVAAGVIVAGAIFMTAGSGGNETTATADNADAADTSQQEQARDVFTPVSADDHILGNPDAPIKIVEYSDLECPFCKNFHFTIQNILDEYGADGTVAWVYRHAPIEQLHSKALREAEAAECAAELGGNRGFWSFVDHVFEITPSNNRLDLDRLPEIAEETGLNKEAFSACLEDNDYADGINAQLQNGIDTAAAFDIRFGTPFSVLVGPDGEIRPISGAQRYATVKQMIDEALAEEEE